MKAIEINNLSDCLGGYKNFRYMFLTFKTASTLSAVKMFKK